MKDRQHNGQKISINGQTTIYKTLHIKLNIEEHEPTKNWGWTEVLGKGTQYINHPFLYYHKLVICVKIADSTELLLIQWLLIIE